MKKIKYQGGLTKLISSKIAKNNKARFTSLISKKENLKQLFEEVKLPVRLEIDVVSFSSTFDFSEQLLSILSFVKYVGIPSSWTVYSDDSHTLEQVQLFKK